MRVTSLVNANSSNESLKIAGSASEGKASFHTVLGKISGNANEADLAVPSSFSGHPASSVAPGFKNVASAQRGARPRAQGESSSKKGGAAGGRSKTRNQSGPSSGAMQSEESSQPTPTEESAGKLPALVAIATPALPVPNPDELGKLPVAEENAATGSGLVGTSSVVFQEFSNASDSSAKVADSGAVSVAQDCRSLSLLVDPRASASHISTDSSRRDSSLPFTLESSTYLDETDTLAPKGAVMTQPLGAPTDASATPMPETDASAAGISELSQTNVVVGMSPMQGSVPSVLSTGLTSVGLAHGTIVKAKTMVDAGHITKVSSAAMDHDGKHKEGNSTASTESRGEGTITALSNSSSEGNRSDSPRTPAVDVAAVQQPTTAPNHGFSAMSDSSSSSPASQNPGSTVLAAARDATASGSLPEVGNAPALSSAQLIHSIRHSEMRLGIQSDEFGSMSISTSLGRQSLSAQISTEHSELSRALAVHLPAMEQKLSTAYGVPAKVEVNSASLSQSTSTDTSSGQQRQNERQQANSTRSDGPLLSTDMGMPVTTSSYPSDTVSSRLDIRV